TTLVGGSSSGSSAFMGMGNTGTGNLITLNFSGGGNLTMTGGSATQTGAVMGTGRNQANATANITVTAADITLDDGAISEARFGHSSNNNGPGNIVVTALGNLALNASNGVGSAIRTTGNVTLHADMTGKSISETGNSTITG